MCAKIKKSLAYSGYKHPHKPKGIGRGAFQKVYWPYLPLILVIGSLVAMAYQSGVFRNSPQALEASTNISISKLVNETNQQRASNNERPLTLNAKLDEAAQAKANDMVERNYWSHFAPNGTAPWAFIDAAHYTYQKVGENLATGFADEHSSVLGWMASPSHRHNLLDPSYTEVGFGTARSSNYAAGGGGPMAVVVAFYGKPAASSAAAKTLGLSNENQRTSHAQLALAQFPFANLATAAAFLALVAALFIWASRHFMAFRRLVTKSESYAVGHPLFDIGLLVIAALAYILSRSAGLVK